MQQRFHLIALAVLSTCGLAQAQQGEPASKLERVEVTGSMIKRLDSETPAPVSVISRKMIERSGATSLDELLRMDSSTGTGSLNDMDTGNGFATGTASIGLRGMGSAATLTLINGRRLAPAAVVDPNSGQSTVFNVNSIPVSAIERVEILKDGASSLYGSDAMAGVVNIILRKDYRGQLVSLNAQQSLLDGLFKTATGSAMLGFGNLDSDGFNLFGGIDVYKRDGVMIAEAPDRVRQDLFGPLFGRLTTDSTSAYPGNLYTYNAGKSGSFRAMMPGCAPENQLPTSATNAVPVCKFNADAAGIQYTGDQTRKAGFLRGSLALGKDTILSAELLASRVESAYAEASTSRTEALTQWGDAKGNAVLFNGLALPGSHPDNPTRLATVAKPVVMKVGSNSYSFTKPTVLGLRYRFADIPSASSSVADNLRFVLSATTLVAGWDVDTGFLHHIQKNQRIGEGRLSLSGLNKALETGSYRFGGSNSAEAIAGIARNTLDEGRSVTSSLDARGSRELGELAGGAMMLGLGGELRRETFSVEADPLMAKGDIIGRGIGEAQGSRNVAAAYAELQLPLVKNLETQVALRGEHYSDFGSAVTGKLGAKYKLMDGLALRGTHATGFRAPSLSQIAKSAVFAFSTVQDKQLCPVKSTGNDDCERRISSVNQSNPNLQPEKSKSYTLGLLFEPAKGAELVLDAWYFDRKGEVDRLTAQQVIDRESEFSDSVIRFASDVPGKPGQITQVLRKFRNLAQSKTGGIDFESSFRWSASEGNDFKIKFSGSRMLTRKRQAEEGQPVIETLGFYGVPRVKSKVSLDWDRGPWSLTLTSNYAGSFRSHSATGSCQAELVEAKREDLCTMAAWVTGDLAMVYRGFNGLKLSATLRNFTGAKPPFDPTEGDTGFDSTYSNPYGRYLSVTASYEF
ncbi:TonB-dependent receptor plug domain-containing protein [Paucibacter sp. Y2R2-4]|uniref:TonB-dependent receptor plug domain-containing protein n=1 Tax=Paucibacter sp. Y2R2-4 TaxID=2893553 RepID=UPI0021E48C8A|nr:TonB-dependent receptor [Paucibacter sp. Y2R2-4]MCV2350835.1 TonB-dependent receptor [Paucibacter sp. Y2R2-4]